MFLKKMAKFRPKLRTLDYNFHEFVFSEAPHPSPDGYGAPHPTPDGSEEEYEDAMDEESVEEGKRRRKARMMRMNSLCRNNLVAALRNAMLIPCSVSRGSSHQYEECLNGSVFGVPAQWMQCSADKRGNCVPTALLMLQGRLYSEGGLQAEGIFRISAQNGDDECVREKLSRGILPDEVDVHCLAGLIKAWFRELPDGVLDSLAPEQVARCNSEQDCKQLVRSLPSTEAALLDWAINLMADVVLHEHCNKMNTSNIAMVFAPNMTRIEDPLIALKHVVQLINLLKTLINITIRERQQ